MAIETPQFKMADRLAGGKLAEVLHQYKDSGASYSAVVRGLFADYGIEVTAPTVGVWLSRLDEPEQVAG